MTIDRALSACLEATDSPDGSLPWSWRVRLWDAMNRAFSDESLFRRQVLAHVVVRETLPAFAAIRELVPARMQGLPQGFIADCGRLLRGEIRERQTKVGHFEDDIENAMSLYDLGRGVYSVIATYKALPAEVERLEISYQERDYQRVWMEDYRLTEADDEWSSWECHFWAACVAAGAPGTPEFDRAGHQRYWRRWVELLVPQVLGSHHSVSALLE